MNSFVWYESWSEELNTLPEADKARFTQFIVNYGVYNSMPTITGLEMAFFMHFKNDIDNQRAKRQAQYQNGCKGGRPNKANETKNNPDKANETQNNPTKANKTGANLDVDVDVDVNVDGDCCSSGISLAQEIYQGGAETPPLQPQPFQEIKQKLLSFGFSYSDTVIQDLTSKTISRVGNKYLEYINYVHRYVKDSYKTKTDIEKQKLLKAALLEWDNLPAEFLATIPKEKACKHCGARMLPHMTYCLECNEDI